MTQRVLVPLRPGEALWVAISLRPNISLAATAVNGSEVRVVILTAARCETILVADALVVTDKARPIDETQIALATTRAGYVGMIGSRRKIKLIFEDLIAKGIPAETLDRVHAPLGFEIGSQTVPEIAISIVAELISCRNLGSTDVPRRVRVQAGTVKT